MKLLSAFRCTCSGVGRSAEKLISGMYMRAFGNVVCACRKICRTCSVECLVLTLRLLMPTLMSTVCVVRLGVFVCKIRCMK